MNWLDIVLVSVIAIATLAGLWVGIIKAVLSMVGIIVGVILAGRFYTPLSEQLTFIPQEGIAKIVAFAIILIAVMVAAIVIANILKWAASMLMLGWVNRLGGAVFGVLMGAITCGAILAAWVKFFGAGETIIQSIMAGFLLDNFPLVLSLLPEEFEAVRSFFQ